MEDKAAPYCPSLDESIVPLNYIATYVIEVDKEKRKEVDRLDHLNLKDKLRRVWETLNEEEDMKDILNLDLLWDKPSKRKSWADAERLRKIGNTKYAKGLLMEALCLYNDALCFLPPNMKDPSKDIFPLIVANRSLVLYEIGSYKPALQDIKLAQDSGYPQNLLYKLQVRQAACFWALGQVEVAKKCFERSEESASRYIKSEEDIKKALDYIKDKKIELTESTFEKLTSKQNKPINCVVPDPHSQYPTFTSKVDIFQTEAKGRHVVAKEVIKPGDVIAVDTAILGSLLASKYSSNCLHCLASIVRIFPCWTCSMVRFCSTKCQKEAMGSYHGYECKLGLGDLHAKVSILLTTPHSLMFLIQN